MDKKSVSGKQNNGSEHKIRRRIIRITASLLIVFTVLFLLQRLLVPKYVDDVVEGAFVAEYYAEENKEFDVIFIGDCEVYSNFSPKLLWEEYGYNSYIRGSAEQYIWQSYYLLEDTLNYYIPEVVVFNIQSLQFGESQNEAYNRMSIEGMKWSKSKIGAILSSMTEDESFLDYVFPILRYHTRWSDLSASDIKYMFSTETVTHNGYYMRVDVYPAEDVPEGNILADYSFSDYAWQYLDMMVELCEEYDIQLILIKAPSLYPYWYDEYEEQVEEYAAEHGLLYYNFLEVTDEIGLDYSTDTYDGGQHLNLSGAEKLTEYFGEILSEVTDLEDRRGDAELDEIWEEKIAAYEAEKQAQYEYYGIEAEE